jgi:hypothetical protein
LSSPAFEAFLARLYTDEALLAAFLSEPEETARAAGLDTASVAALCAIDRNDLIMAARSFRAKRAALHLGGPAGKPRPLLTRIKSALRRY